MYYWRDRLQYDIIIYTALYKQEDIQIQKD